MSIEENPQSNTEEGEIEAIQDLLLTKFPELHSFTLNSVSLPVPGSGLRVVEMEGESETRYFKVDVATDEVTEWGVTERPN